MNISLVKVRKYNLLYPLGIAALLISWLLFCGVTQKFFPALWLSMLFVATLAIGARLHNWILLLTNRKPVGFTVQPNWTTATALSVATVFITGLVSTGIPVSPLMFAVAILLNAVYAMAKIRCWVLGCCGSNAFKIPVQLLESAVFFCFATILVFLKNQLQTGMYVFAFLYPCTRFCFHLLKGYAISATFIFINTGIAGLYIILGSTL